MSLDSGQSRLGFPHPDAPERSLETLEFNLESGLPGAAILPPLCRSFYVCKTERFKAYVRGLGLVDYAVAALLLRLGETGSLRRWPLLLRKAASRRTS